MKLVQIDYDMSGHAYDPEAPTIETERLCYKLNAILDELKTQGFELRMVEPIDITDSETAIKTIFDLTVSPPENPVTVVTPANTDMLLDIGIYEALNKARAAWLMAVNSAIQNLDPPADSLAAINETLKAMLTQEPIVYLSDGTPIYGKTGAVA